jgi:hypothetical protein
MNKIIIAVFLLLSFLLWGFSPFLDTEWKLEKNKNGVSVYTRNITGSSYKEFKAVVTVSASLSTVVSVFKNTNGFIEWMDKCIEASQLKKISETEGIGYYVIDAPWPVTNRDMVTQYVIHQDSLSKVVVISMEGKPGYIAAKEGLVRLPKLKGFWKFIPKGNNNTEIIYQVHAELGGSVPAWLANYTVVDSPFKTMENFVVEVKKDKYKNAKFSFIRD